MRGYPARFPVLACLAAVLLAVMMPLPARAGQHPEPAEVVAPFEAEMHEWFGTPAWYKKPSKSK